MMNSFRVNNQMSIEYLGASSDDALFRRLSRNDAPINKKAPSYCPRLPRRGRDSRTFCHFRLRAKTAYLSKYPRKLKTIGDHLRKQRFDLGLKQKEDSRIIGVTRAMISTWEMQPVEPAVKHIPKIIEFLGYVPLDHGKTLGQRITIYRKTLGLSHYQLAQKPGLAPCTIMNWEHDRVKNVEKKIRPYLDGLVEFD